jgi:cell division protein FtsW
MNNIQPLSQQTRRLDGPIAAIVIILMALGTVMVFSASANLTQELNLRRFYDFSSLRQMLFFPLALATMYVASVFDYRRLSLHSGWLKSPTAYLFAISVVLLVMVLTPLGTEINYARRWLRIPLGPVAVSFQPSELAKWSLVLLLVGFCDKFADSMHVFRRGVVPVFLASGVVIGLIVREDFGTAALIAVVAWLVLALGGVRWRHLLLPVPVLAVVFFLVIAASPTRVQRILAFLNPQSWSSSAGYQAGQSLIAIGTGGIRGKGLGLGVCKYGHLPQDTSDFIFAVIAEELGLAGTLSVIVLFAAFVVFGMLVVVRCQDRFGRLLAAAIVITIAAQAALNIGVVTVLLPTKGIPLPFVSAGGTSLLLSAAAVGVLLNIARRGVCGRAEVGLNG